MKQPRGAAGADLLFFIFFLIVLGVVWALTGGPDRDISRSGPFLNPPFPLGNGAAYTVPGVPLPTIGDVGSGGGGGTTTKTETLADIIARLRLGLSGGPGEPSPYASGITLSIGNARATTPTGEYLILKTAKSLDGTRAISQWRVESTVTTLGTTVGQASYLPISGGSTSEAAIMLGPNTTVYLVTGHAPTGESFRKNLCTGYFTNAQSFSPTLSRECPTGEAELTTAAKAGFIPSDACVDYVERMSTCKLITSGFPATINDQCQNFITTSLTYNGCVNAHKNDAGFYKNEWYVYLDRDQELWKSSNEHIRLLDENGKVVASVSY